MHFKLARKTTPVVGPLRWDSDAHNELATGALYYLLSLIRSMFDLLDAVGDVVYEVSSKRDPMLLQICSKLERFFNVFPQISKSPVAVLKSTELRHPMD
ncbi:hypothetical protein CEXT_20631 [Caerostris extrusa]|uniref:Uncharacterized protein n=1 Tax=Caerostris extrusa TaxID=172846 RepID=A0AAV4MMD6_CAEEX|nr:hypothetical protein CEXT_20631 [Caerostris extrusa]